MCTAVVGGSIHLVATRSSAATDQSTDAPTMSHRTKEWKKPFQRGPLAVLNDLGVNFRIIAGAELPLMVSLARDDFRTAIKRRLFARRAMFGGMGIVALVGEERQILFVESC